MIITKSTPFTKEEIEMKNKAILGALAMDLKELLWDCKEDQRLWHLGLLRKR